MSQNNSQRVSKKNTDINQNQQDPLQIDLSKTPIQLSHGAIEMTDAQQRLYQQAQNMPRQDFDRNALTMSVRVARNSQIGSSDPSQQDVVFPDIANANNSYQHGHSYLEPHHKRHHSNYLDLNKTQIPDRKQRFSSQDNYQDTVTSLPNNFAHAYNGNNTNERLSQESSPMGSPFPKRNIKFKNVRNYNNLYEDRCQASKNVEMQDQLRLGFKRSWIVNSHQQQLPKIANNYARGNMQYNSMKSCSYEQDYRGQMYNTQNYQQLKRITRNPEDGKAELELRKSPEKPATHHGYQVNADASENMSSDPQINQQLYNTTYSDRFKTNNTMLNSPHAPADVSCSSNFMGTDPTLSMIKPVLKKNMLHLQNNVIVTFKSFEIQVIKSLNDDKPGSQVSQHKFFNPIYVPLMQAQHLLTLNPNQMEIKIVRDLKLAPNEKSFHYIPQAAETVNEGRTESPSKATEGSPSPRASPIKGLESPTRVSGNRAKLSDMSPSKNSVKSQESFVEPVEDILPEEIHTSLFLQSNNTDYRIIIRPPSVEYSIPAKNFLFMKTLTRSEIQEFFAERFITWPPQSIRCLTQYKKFTDLLALIQKGSSLKAGLIRNQGTQPGTRENSLNRLSQERKGNGPTTRVPSNQQRLDGSASYVQIYVLEEQSGQIQEYNSITEFKKKRFLQFKGGLLKGCIDRNGSLGTIKVRPFSVSIKSLDSDYEFKSTVKTTQWGKIVGQMQRKCIELPEEPAQLVDKVCNLFHKCIIRAQQNNSTQINFQIESILKTNKDEKSDMLRNDDQINALIQELTTKIVQPSQTLQTITDLKNNARGDSSPQKLKDVSKEEVQDSIDQQRKRFASDARNASRKFLTLQKRSKMIQMPHLTEKGSTERYLVEIEYPSATVAFQGQTYTKHLTEDDLRYLIATNFGRWKNFVMTRHFRLELNIGHEEPLPKIVEDKRGEDELISETDPKDKFPVTEEEKPRIEATQGRLTNWFPI